MRLKHIKDADKIINKSNYIIEKPEEYKGKWTCFESCITHKPSTKLLIEGLHFQIVD